MSKIDLTDAYYMLSIEESHRKYLRFEFGNETYEFSCLAFGLNVAPLVFTKLLKPVMSFLRGRGLLSVVYLDDFLLIGKDFDSCAKNFSITSKTLKYLGFILQKEKCRPMPEQRRIFLGLQFDTSRMLLELPREKRLTMAKLIKRFLNIDTCKIRELAQFIGSLIACCPAMEYSWLYTKRLESAKIRALARNNNNYEANVSIIGCKEDLVWWKDNIMSNYKDLDTREQPHPLWKSLILVAARLSAQPY
ncbi:hypothetical protein TKK_0018079 [Trichogramma kaykai]